MVGDWWLDSFQEISLSVILKPCAEFQFPTMPATGQKVCGGGWLS